MLHVEVICSQRHNARICFLWVVLEFTFHVLGAEILDLLLVCFLDVSLRPLKLIFVVGVWLLDAFDTHDSHEVVSGVAEFWALEVDGAEVIYGQASFVEVNHLTPSKKHQPVEHLEDV